MFPSKTPGRSLLLPGVILVLGLVLTYVLQDAARRTAHEALAGEFQFRVGEIADNIQRRMTRYEQVLEGVTGLFAASRSVERGEFAAYVRSLGIDKFPGIQGVGFAPLVRPDELPRHRAAVRAEGFPDYDIRPPGQRSFYTPIVFLEPFDWRNQRAFGYDMYSEAVRRIAMDRARDLEQAALSGKVRLVQETEKNVQAGFLIYLPVYRNGLPHRTTEERRAALMGWVYAPFRMNDLMEGVLGTHFGEISAALDLEIFDGDAVTPDKLMFDSDADAGRENHRSAFKAVRPLSLFGSQWTLAVRSMPVFDTRLDTDKANIMTLAGTAGSLLLALVVWLLATGRERAVAMAERMTEELRRSEAGQRKLNRALRLLSACNTTLVHAEDEHRLLAEICRLCVETGNYRLAWVGFAEHDAGKNVRPIAQSGYEAGYLDTINITWADDERGQGPTGTAIRTARPYVNQNVLTNPRMAPWREAASRRGYQSSIALPLVADARVLGALNIYSSEPDAFDDEEVRLLEELAGDLAFGIVTLRTRAEHAAATERINFLAHFDPLTHLPNRVLLRDRFEHAAFQARNEGRPVAMLYLDMDNFQQINDGYGHETGDQALVAAVERLRGCIAPTDTLSRLSGDEFIVLLTDVADAGTVAGVAASIRDAFAEPVPVAGQALNISFSIGIGLYPGDGEDFDTLLKRADTAVHSAKEAGRNTYRFYTRQMNADLMERMRLRAGLTGALRNREFRLHYQPQVDAASGRIVGAEALLRWQHPEDGMISPARFIPLAEESGHIVAMGEWVLGEACRQAKAWHDAGLPPFVMAVNLSAVQFKHGGVPEQVLKALAESDLSADRLELELTESILLQDVDATIEVLRRLKAIGVKLSIDDFGTGYSSLAYLKRLAVDKLKIDQSFVRDMLTDADGASIVKAIIQLGHTLQLEVIAEGVETEAQLRFLQQAGCDEIQGYLCSRPVPAEGFAELLETGVCLR